MKAGSSAPAEPHDTTAQLPAGKPDQASARQVVRLAACLTAALGLTVLSGWLTGIELLKSLVPGFIPMAPASALAFLLFGIALTLRASSARVAAVNYVANGMVAVAGLIGATNLIQQGPGLSFLIQQLAAGGADATASTRMAVTTAVCFPLLACAFLLLNSARSWAAPLAQTCAAIAGVASFATIMGYLLGIETWISLASGPVMAFSSACGVLALTVAVLFLQPGRGMMSVITSEEISGRVVRVLLGSVLVATPALARLCKGGYELGWYGEESALALFALSQLTSLAGVIVYAGWLLQQFDVQRIRAETVRDNLLADLKHAAERLEGEVRQRTQALQMSELRLRLVLDHTPALIGYVDPQFRYRFCNNTFRDWYGVDPVTLEGKRVRELIGESAWSAVECHYKQAMAGRWTTYERRLNSARAPQRDVFIELVPDIAPTGEVTGVFIGASDITERKTAEAALREREAWLRLVTDNNAACIGYLDAEERFRFCNQTYEEWYGRKANELLGMSVDDLVGKDVYLRIGGYYKDALAGRRTGYERTLQANGELRRISVGLIPDVRENGSVVGVFVSGADVTALRQQEQALQESEERFRNAFDFAAIGMAIVSLDGRFVKVNRSLCEIVGYSNAELLNMTFQQISHPDDLPMDLQQVELLVTGSVRSYQLEKRYLSKTGAPVWALLSVSLVRREDGSPLHFIAQIEDINATKEAAAALRASEERFRLVVRGTHDGIWDWDLLGAHCYYSPRYLELLGYTDVEFGHQRSSFDAHLHPDDCASEARLLDAHFTKRVPYEIEYRLRAKSGEYRWFLARGHATWDSDGKPIRFAGALRDITSQRHAEEQLRQTTHLLRQTERIARIGGWERSLSDNVPVWSDAVREIVEVPPDFEPDIEQAHNFYAPEARPLVREATATLIATGQPYDLELPYITAKGRRIWVHLHAEAEVRDGQVVRIFGTLKDISERKEAELASERSQAFLHSVIEAVPQPLFVKDRAHRLVLFNRSFCELMERERDSLLGKDDTEIFPPHLAQRYFSEDNQAFASGSPLVVEQIHTRTDGSHRWLLKSKQRVVLPDASTYVVGLGTDITGLRQAQDALAQSEELHRLLAQNSSDVIARLSADGVFTYVSAAATRVLGYAPESLVGRSVYGLVHPEERGMAQRVVSQAAEGTSNHTLTCRISREDGNYVWLETALRGLYDHEAPSASHIIAVSRDVDARVRVTEALHRLQYVLDNTLDLIFIYDAESLRFTYVNKGATDALGYSRSALLGMRPWQVRSGMSEAQYRAEMHPLLDGELHSQKRECNFVRADGTELPVDATLQILRRTGERPTLICVARDATERKRVDRMKNEFVSTVSHELRTPLTSIRGSLGLIAGGAAGAVSEQALGLLRIAHNNSERLMRLINDILDIDKMESGSMRFDMQPHGLRSLLLQAVDANRSYAGELGVEIMLEAPDIPDLLIQANTDRFQQVMANLLSNAAQFSPRGDTITVEARQTGKVVCISVSDHGPGIPDEFRSKIFRKFSQADSSDTRRKGGTGLGLSIVKAIVQEHGGDVWFDTRPGSGTTFHVTFPLADARGEPALRSFSTQIISTD